MNKRQRKKRDKKRYPIGSRMWLDKSRNLPILNGFLNNGNFTFKVVNGIIVQKISNF